MDIGVPELIIILVIVVLIFGPRRLGEVAGELGKGIRNFREGLSGKDEKQSPPEVKSESGGEQPKA
jgi:sec-independent protein translocase protein TatA